jgi:hypothetical protein
MNFSAKIFVAELYVLTTKILKPSHKFLFFDSIRSWVTVGELNSTFYRCFQILDNYYILIIQIKGPGVLTEDCNLARNMHSPTDLRIFFGGGRF